MLTGNAIRRVILDQAHRAGEGHVGSALCIADILAVLYRDVVAGRLHGESRDRVVLSKGHAALALYAALYLGGELSARQLLEYCEDGSELGVHPQHGIPGVEFTTGSLGQGLSFATGCALAARLNGKEWRTYVLCSDAECDEGAIWESAMFAAHHRLGNLVAIIDYNHQQAMGATDSILSLGDLRLRWEAFGWRAVEVDGHDEQSIRAALTLTGDLATRPLAVIANTVFGKGVDFMEGQLRWHYSSMTDADYSRALASLGESL
jgi:transketolase